MKDQEIRDLFKRHDVPLSQSDVWDVNERRQDAPYQPVIKHSALERLGAKLGIKWLEPEILRSERDEAVIVAKGYLNYIEDKTPRSGPIEWSIGEACINQNYRVSGKQAAYPYAMAEKRAKDRVILKLAGLHGVYSEEEADDFKEPLARPEQFKGEYAEAPPPKPDPIEGYHPPGGRKGEAKSSREIYVEKSVDHIAKSSSAAELLQWAKIERQKVWPQYGIETQDPDGQRIVKVYKDRMAVLEAPRAGAR